MSEELVLTHPEPPPAPVPAPAPRVATLDSVRDDWKYGSPWALEEPLLPVLLLTELGSDWIVMGLRRYAGKMLAMVATGVGHGLDRKLSKTQVDGPLRDWALEQLGERRADLEVCRELDEAIKRAGQQARWLSALATASIVVRAVGLPLWPSALHIARRLDAVHRKRASSYRLGWLAEPLEQLGALDWRFDTFPP